LRDGCPLPRVRSMSVTRPQLSSLIVSGRSPSTRCAAARRGVAAGGPECEPVRNRGEPLFPPPRQPSGELAAEQPPLFVLVHRHLERQAHGGYMVENVALLRSSVGRTLRELENP
jgi:hypothetical protein